MKRALGNSVQAVHDVESFDAWVSGPLTVALPYRGLLCGQYIAHSKPEFLDARKDAGAVDPIAALLRQGKSK